jgi:phage tail-like protein
MSWLEHLPATLREPDPADPGFLEGLLAGLEAVLSGAGDADDPGLEELLDGIEGPDQTALTGLERFFSPRPPAPTAFPERHQAPVEFLDWLAGWVALSLRADVTEAQQRALVANAVPLYRLRGTREGLERLLALYDVGAVIEEDLDAFQIGVHSTIGVDTRIGGGAPHYFRVRVSLPLTDATALEAMRRRLRAIVDSEKPAHTVYTLVIETPTMQIGVRSTIGVDTMLGAEDT